jgi:hypothetical protein
MLSGGAAASRDPTFWALGHAGGGLADVAGSCGAEVFGLPNARVEVRSPTVSRRQDDRLGTCTPNRVSRKRSIEV